MSTSILMADILPPSKGSRGIKDDELVYEF
jgi:hypothetical protein